MVKLVNRVKVVTTTTGTGTITLGAAVDGFQSFASAGVSNGDVVRYVIEDGDDWEIGSGTFTSSGTTLSRTVVESSSSGSPLNLTGNAVVFVSAIAADIIQPGDNISELTNDAGYSTTTGTVTSVGVTAGTGITVSGSPITSSGSITVTNAAPDQVVSLTGGSNVTVTGTYPSFTVAASNTNLGYTSAASAGTVTSSTGNNATLPAATASIAGLLTSADKTKLDGIAGVPLGAIIPIRQGLTGAYPIPASGAVDANGFMYCDGAAIPSGNAVSGNTPNLTDGRFLRGSTSAGATGGSATFTLATDNLPSHTHTGTTASDGAHIHTASTSSAGAHTHTGTANSAGAHTHSVRQDEGTSTIPNNSNINLRLVNSSTGSAGAHTHTLSIDSGGAHTHPVTVDSGGAHTHTFTTGATGSGTAVSHIPIYFDVVYLMRVN
jgi:hypothetical protein